MTNSRTDRYTAALQFAEKQVAQLIKQHPDYLPSYTVGGKWRHAGESWTHWTDGFLGGMMWQFHLRHREACDHVVRTDDAHLAHDPWRQRAEHYSKLVEHRKSDRKVHDLGFIFLSTYLPWHQLTKDAALQSVLVEAGQTLAQRFNERGKYLHSFLGPESLFIDIMMNVPLIFYAANATGDDRLRSIANDHCLTTRDRLIRPDGSTAHEAIFDPQSGKFLRESTQQGLSPASTWARGLAWSLYGFSKCFALTGNDEYLVAADRNADYWVTHVPTDGVPYWDFAADKSQPAPWGAQKDSSAAAIAASGLLDLAKQTKSAELAVHYRDTALRTLDTLVSHDYLADTTPGWEGVLKHGVYHTGKSLGVDESLLWGDYFFVEALTKVVCGHEAPDYAMTSGSVHKTAAV